MRITRCRICKSEDLYKFLDLGMHPPSDAFLKKDQLDSVEEKFPLDVYFCGSCCLVQLGFVVPPEKLFTKNYVYVSSISTTMRSNWMDMAAEINKKFGVPEGSLVVDIGGNDGTLLKCFHDSGFSVTTLNIDPSDVAKTKVSEDVDVINDFFSENVASEVAKKFGKARIITGTNVFAHVDDLDDFMRGVGALLEDDGVLVLEFPYLMDLLEKIEFDTIYHEHLSYLSVGPLIKLYERFGMIIVDIDRIPVHGGSLRIFVKKKGLGTVAAKNVQDLVRLEKERGLYDLETYKDFSVRVSNLKKNLVAMLRDLKSGGKKIAGDTAPAKGNTLLNYCGIDDNVLDFIAEINPIKQGLYTPGTHIPVVPLEKIYEDKPDYLLILAWNFKDDIMRQQKDFRESGGRFIVPVPEPEIV
ncbi:MAG: class I SAM-dependent methyltransferase [Candidatus Aenigmarchaeota archaeon]|nr:class I SAM-dependent methyltransferase [Candidatus Aenigmarchaeota archaeon]